jgi:hypothetical protein
VVVAAAVLGPGQDRLEDRHHACCNNGSDHRPQHVARRRTCRDIRCPQWWLFLVAILSIVSDQGSLVGMGRFAKRHRQALNELLCTDFTSISICHADSLLYADTPLSRLATVIFTLMNRAGLMLFVIPCPYLPERPSSEDLPGDMSLKACFPAEMEPPER